MIQKNSRERPLLCVFDLFTGRGGTQSVMGSLLPALSESYRVVAMNPYRNQSYADRLRGTGVELEELVSRAPLTPYIGGRNRFDRISRIARRAPWMLEALWALRRWCVKHRPQIVYFNQLPIANLFARVLPSGPRLVFHSHGHMNAEEIRASASQLLNRRFDAVIAVSKVTKDLLVQAGVNPNKIDVVYNAVDAERVRCQALQGNAALPQRSEGRPVVLHVGAFSHIKAQDLTIRAFAEVCNQFDVDLWLCGDVSSGADPGFGDRLREMVAQFGIDQRVHFLGWRDDVAFVQNAADLVILPSRAESFGLVLTEAMCLNKPCVGSSRGGIPEVIAHNETGLVCDLEPHAIAAGILTLLRDPVLQQEMGAAGARRVQDLFSPRRQQIGIRSVLERILAGVAC